MLAAEELGSIREVDRWVAGRAIEVAAAGHPVDLNLSVRSLDDPLLELIRHRTGETGADPGDLVLELSEQGVEDLVTLQLLQDLGVDEAQGYALGRPEPLESLDRAPA